MDDDAADRQNIATYGFSPFGSLNMSCAPTTRLLNDCGDLVLLDSLQRSLFRNPADGSTIFEGLLTRVPVQSSSSSGASEHPHLVGLPRTSHPSPPIHPVRLQQSRYRVRPRISCKTYLWLCLPACLLAEWASCPSSRGIRHMLGIQWSNILQTFINRCDSAGGTVARDAQGLCPRLRELPIDSSRNSTTTASPRATSRPMCPTRCVSQSNSISVACALPVRASAFRTILPSFGVPLPDVSQTFLAFLSLSGALLLGVVSRIPEWPPQTGWVHVPGSTSRPKASRVQARALCTQALCDAAWVRTELWITSLPARPLVSQSLRIHLRTPEPSRVRIPLPQG